MAATSDRHRTSRTSATEGPDPSHRRAEKQKRRDRPVGKATPENASPLPVN